jgi:hypothetical protein
MRTRFLLLALATTTATANLAAQLPGGEEEEDGLPCVVRLYEIGSCGGSGLGHHKTDNQSSRNAKGADHGGDCYVCMQGDSAVSTYVCHSQGCLGQEPDPEAIAAYAAILRAADRGDRGTVMALAFKVPTQVVVNRSRLAVQIKSCSGEVIASFRVDDPVALEELARAVESARHASTRASLSG